MPLTTLDPTPALVVIDLQKGIVSGTVAHVVQNAAALAQAFRDRLAEDFRLAGTGDAVEEGSGKSRSVIPAKAGI